MCCCSSDVEEVVEEVEEGLDPVYVRWSCPEAVSHRHFTSLHFSLSFLDLLFFPHYHTLFLSLLVVVVGITAFVGGGVAKVEFGLGRIIEGRKICQDCLHNHSLAFTRLSRAERFLE